VVNLFILLQLSAEQCSRHKFGGCTCVEAVLLCTADNAS
jgi:hypothetical protein